MRGGVGGRSGKRDGEGGRSNRRDGEGDGSPPVVSCPIDQVVLAKRVAD